MHHDISHTSAHAGAGQLLLAAGILEDCCYVLRLDRLLTEHGTWRCEPCFLTFPSDQGTTTCRQAAAAEEQVQPPYCDHNWTGCVMLCRACMLLHCTCTGAP